MATVHEWYYNVGASNQPRISPAIRMMQDKALALNSQLKQLDMEQRRAIGNASEARLSLKQAERMANTKNVAMQKAVDPKIEKLAVETKAKLASINATIDKTNGELARINRAVTELTKLSETTSKTPGLGGAKARIAGMVPRIMIR